MGKLVAGKSRYEENAGNRDRNQNQGGNFFRANLSALHALVDHEKTKHAYQ
ncbi:MAG: hypothetical protein K9L89_08435 [Kiritimatiellales bacterium]|nr:hypothetical protein [Kiritimatiellales bacterium]